MSFEPMPLKKASAISNGIFLVSLGILLFTEFWWPGILLALWATIASRQYLSGRLYYALSSSVILLGLFIAALINFNFDILAPILLVIGGMIIIVREYFFPGDTNGEEKSQEILEDADIDRD